MNHLRPIFLVLGLIAQRRCSCGSSDSDYGGPGMPAIRLAGQPDAGLVRANNPNPCELDVDFGEVSIGQSVVASIEIVNSGSGLLDLASIDPALDPSFGMNYDAGAGVEPGTFYDFVATFEPLDAGEVSSTFVIQTDGINMDCPSTDDLTVVLVGTGTKPD